MNKNNFLFFVMLLISSIGLVSCGEDETTVEEFPNWQSKNDTYFKSFTDSVKKLIANGDTAQWKFFKTWSKDKKEKLTDSICVQVITKGTGSGCPLYNDSVRVHYLGKLLPSTSYSAGMIIAQSYYGTYDPTTSVPNSFLVSGLIDGFATAVMEMHIGDHWRVYIPYNLGYGSSASSSVPAYSTLIYDITLAAYSHVNGTLPNWSAKSTEWIEE